MRSCSQQVVTFFLIRRLGQVQYALYNDFCKRLVPLIQNVPQSNDRSVSGALWPGRQGGSWPTLEFRSLGSLEI